MIKWKPVALALLTASTVQLANANPTSNTDKSTVVWPPVLEPVTSTGQALLRRLHDVKDKLVSYHPTTQVSSIPALHHDLSNHNSNMFLLGH
jgi:hypothetical protein